MWLSATVLDNVYIEREHSHNHRELCWTMLFSKVSTILSDDCSELRGPLGTYIGYGASYAATIRDP